MSEWLNVPIIKSFENNYWKHYTILEEDFLSVQRYVTLEPDNYKTYSIEYNRLYQAIGSEIDVLMQYLCNLLANNKNTKISEYEKTLNEYCLKITQEEVKVKINPKQNKTIIPFVGWCKDNHPQWWKLYNKVKHDRLNECTDEKSTYFGKKYYKAANLENVLHSLSALYVLEFYCMVILCNKNYICGSAGEANTTYNNLISLYYSKIFSLKRWDCLRAFMGTFIEPKLIKPIIAESFIINEVNQ